MPIDAISFDDGIFFTKESGVITNEDARYWREHLDKASAESDMPFVALVDALEVTDITPQAGRLFAEAARTENLFISAIATSEAMSFKSNLIGIIGKRGHTYVFPTLDEARAFAEEQLRYCRQHGME